MPESLEVSTVLPAKVERIYQARLTSKERGAFIGASARILP